MNPFLADAIAENRIVPLSLTHAIQNFFITDGANDRFLGRIT
jgi:hypothetical protein